MTTTVAKLEKELKALLGASAKFWPQPTDNPKADDYYEAYLWAETVETARCKGWTVEYHHAGPTGDRFKFRMGPGVFNSPAKFTYARFKWRTVTKGELHIGVRIQGRSGVLHEFDVVGIDQSAAIMARLKKLHPGHAATRFHVEAKFHKSDLTLGVGRAIVGLKADCPAIRPMLVSRAQGADTIRALINTYGGVYVHNAFPTDTGISILRNCLAAALTRWRR